MIVLSISPVASALNNASSKASWAAVRFPVDLNAEPRSVYHFSGTSITIAWTS